MCTPCYPIFSAVHQQLPSPPFDQTVPVHLNCTAQPLHAGAFNCTSMPTHSTEPPHLPMPAHLPAPPNLEVAMAELRHLAASPHPMPPAPLRRAQPPLTTNAPAPAPVTDGALTTRASRHLTAVTKSSPRQYGRHGRHPLKRGPPPGTTHLMRGIPSGQDQRALYHSPSRRCSLISSGSRAVKLSPLN